MNKKNSISERLGVLAREDSTTNTKQAPVDYAECAGSQGEQLIQRCVIIQRDEKGYGLTVSGDNPVFVQQVKDNGAAARAGVQQGDRIIKVNGTLVTNSNHIEVVKLIKSGPFVALTLLGRPPGHSHSNKPLPPLPPEPPTSPMTTSHDDKITAPKAAVNEEAKDKLERDKVDIFRQMRQSTLDTYENAKKDYDNKPNSENSLKISDTHRMLKKLDDQLYHLTGITDYLQTPSEPFSHSKEAGNSSQTEEDILDSTEAAPSTFVTPSGPRPWLPHGKPFHTKSQSIPESFYTSDDPEIQREKKVGRTQSDRLAKGRSLSGSGGYHPVHPFGHVQNSLDTVQDQKSKTTSLPDNASGSPTQSPISSPVTIQNERHSWEEVREMNDDFEQQTSYMHFTPTGTPKPGSPTLSASPPSGSSLVHISPKQVDVICMEDDDFTSDDGDMPVEDHGPFGDLHQLKNRPAHLAVFMHYLISNSDPCPLFFYLVTENFSLASGKFNEMRKWAYEIHSTFLVPNAPLIMPVAEDVLINIDNQLGASNNKSDDSIRNIFHRSRIISHNMVNEDLADFRRTGALGLGSLYGAHELQDENMDRSSELKIAEKYLVPHLERLIEDKFTDRSQAMASALTTFLRSVGLTKIGSSSSNMLERCPSFVNTKDQSKLRSKLFPKTKKVAKDKPHYVKNHTFVAQHYYQTTFCTQCTAVIWGIGNQGYQCNNCKFNCHKQCLDLIEESCVGPKNKSRKEPRPSSVFRDFLTGSGSSKPSIRPPSDEPCPSPNPDMDKKPRTVFYPTDEEESMKPTSQSSWVNKVVSKMEDISKENNKMSPPPSPRSSPDKELTVPSGRVTRSESLTGRKPANKPKRHTKSDVDKDEGALRAVLVDQPGDSTSSSTTSQSGLAESPTGSTTDVGINEETLTPGIFRFDDSDMEVELEMPPLSTVIPNEKLKKLKPKKKKVPTATLR